VSNNEAQWLQQAIQGDEEAFARLVELYQRPVFNLCYRMLDNQQEAEDAAQETFWRAFQNLRRYDAQRSFITWLLSIAAHYCIDQQRKRKVPTFDLDLLPEESAPDPSPDPEKVVSRTEEERQLHQLLNSLNPQDRAAMVMRYWYDLSDEEIAQSLSLTVSAVKSRLHRARLLLAQRWQAAHPKLLQEERTKHERTGSHTPAF
jgi:RNA polymerase sigma-70 factor (ECF subfamily)